MSPFLTTHIEYHDLALKSIKGGKAKSRLKYDGILRVSTGGICKWGQMPPFEGFKVMSFIPTVVKSIHKM